MKDFFYDELNKELEVNANLDKDAGTISGTLSNNSNTQLIANLNDSNDTNDCIFGKLNNLVEIKDYKGWTSETIEVIVDNKNYIIKANLLVTKFASKTYVDESIDLLRRYVDEQLNNINININNLIIKTDETNKQVNQLRIDLTDLNQQLQDEIKNRQEAISKEASTRQEEDNKLNILINNETSAREEQNKKLQQNIDDETQARINADNQLQEKLNTEINERKAADKELQDNLNKEIEDRETAITNLSTDLTNKLNQEITDRTNADSQLQSNIDNLINTKLDASNADRNVMTESSIDINGDNVYLKKNYINLKTLNTTNGQNQIELATKTQAGLMSMSDYSTLYDLKDRVADLEAKTTRLLYTEKTNPTTEDINTFVVGLGYTEPFSGIAVVVDKTFHIWHYYENDNIGWQDDGLDTVNTFTNTNAGIIKGAEVDGKVYAETDGTGSVYGWGNLKGRVSTNEGNISSLQEDLQNETANRTTADKTLQTNINKNSEDITTINNTLNTYGDIVTHNVNEFATSSQGKKADTALQPNDNITELNNNAGYITKNVDNLTNYMTTTQVNSALNEKADSSIVENLTTQVNTNTTNIATNTTDIDGLKTSLETTNANVTENTNNITSNATEINSLKTSKLDTSKANTNVMTELGVTAQNDNVNLNKSYKNLSTQETSNSSTTIPLANDTTAGLMSKADYSQIRENTERIEQLEGQNIRLLYTASDNPTASQIEAFVKAEGYTDTAQWSQIGVVVSGTNHIWRYYTNTATWTDIGVDTVNQFTNTIAGIIKGSAMNGKVYAETDGTGSIYGWDNLNTNVTNNTSAIETETANRKSADETLQTNINTKIGASNIKAGANITISTSGNDVTINAETGEGGTNVYVNNVKQDSVNFNSDPQTQITTNATAISTETTNRANADTTLQSQITTNTTNISNKFISGYGTCSTEGNISAKVVTISDTSWALKTGTIIGVKFTNNNFANNITLNVNNTGAKQVWFGGGVYTAGDGKIVGLANNIIYYIYDGTYWVYISYSGNVLDTIPSAISYTASANAIKIASCTNYQLLAKSYIQVIMSYSNTSQYRLTLNINYKGEKPIYINGKVSSTTNYTLPAGSYLVYYDGTNYYFNTDGTIYGQAKADASNLTTENITSWQDKLGSSMPSTKYTTLTFTNNTSYTAPANGWYSWSGVNSSGSLGFSRVRLTNTTTGLICDSTTYANSGSFSFLCPAKKGDILTLTYSNIGSTNYFRFYYAEGRE